MALLTSLPSSMGERCHKALASDGRHYAILTSSSDLYPGIYLSVCLSISLALYPIFSLWYELSVCTFVPLLEMPRGIGFEQTRPTN